jgi:5'-deoxynucleotidase YfbR-like HD superfamily hydrolase
MNTGTSNEEEIKKLISILRWTFPLKNLPRTGWIHEGSTGESSDSIAAHSHSVSVITLFVAHILKNCAKKSLNIERTLMIAILHDMAESVTGEIPTGIKKRLIQFDFNDIESAAAKLLLGYPAEKWAKKISVENTGVENTSKDGYSFSGLILQYDQCDSTEAMIVKFADILDAFIHAKIIMNREFERYLESAIAKLKTNKEVGDILAEWLDYVIKNWDAIDRWYALPQI